MVKDLRSAWKWIDDLLARVRRLEVATPLENSSISNGRMRFIGGLLRVDSGGRVEIVGSWRFIGPGSITGDVVAEGKWTQNGAWEFNGPGDIAGDVDLTGDLSVFGNVTVLDNGQIKVGNVIITPGSGGRVTVGVGDAQIVLNGQDGTIQAGNLKIDPTEGGGSVVFENGAQLYSGDNGQIELISGGRHVTLTDTRASIGTGGRSVAVVEAGDDVEEGIYFYGLSQDGASSYLGVTDENKVVKMPAGGPGNPGTPGEPGDNPGGYIWPVDQSFPIGDDYAAHVARGSAEPGIDWACPPGTAIWAPGDGTIVDVSNSISTPMGRYVTLVTDEGDWFRFLHNSSLQVSAGQSVTQGQVLAYSGGSGRGSEAGYGAHSHVSFKQGYTGVFPGAGALDDLLAYMASSD